MEWSIGLAEPATFGETYQFRVYAGSEPLELYAVIPQLIVTSTAAETNLPVDITATVTATDQLGLVEARSFDVTATVTITEQRSFGDLARPIDVVATVTLATDSGGLTEARSFDVTATVAATDSLGITAALPITAIATVTATDSAGYTEARSFDVAATVTVFDNITGAPIHYVETGRQIEAAATVTITNRADFNDLVSFPVTATVALVVESGANDEVLAVTIAATVTMIETFGGGVIGLWNGQEVIGMMWGSAPVTDSLFVPGLSNYGGLVTVVDIPPQMVAAHLYALAEEVCSALTVHGAGPTCWCGMYPGAVVSWEHCGECAGGVCGMGYVRLAAVFPYDNFPEPMVDDRCIRPLAWQVEAGALRCLPQPSDGEPPTAEVTTEVALNQIADAYAIYWALRCTGLDIAVGSYFPVGPAGGCVGGYWNAYLPIT